MTSLDDLLKSFGEIVQSEFADQALIDSEDFNRPEVFGRSVGDRPGLVYLGCFGLWLLRNQALNPDEFPGANSQRADQIRSPVGFAQDVLRGKLLPAMIQPGLREFCDAYIRKYNLFADDYQEIVVGGLGLVDMSEVPDSPESLEPVWRKISERLAGFRAGNPHWSARAPRPVVPLTAEEMSPEGWKRAFFSSLQLDSLPHRERQKAISRFWGLVDFVHGSADPSVPGVLLSAITKDFDASLQEAVLRSLFTLPFENVWPAIIADAERLAVEGGLRAVLSLWGNDFSESQMQYLREHFDDAPVAIRNRIVREAQDAERSREPWAIKLQQM